jgi:hypothetical protein
MRRSPSHPIGVGRQDFPPVSYVPVLPFAGIGPAAGSYRLAKMVVPSRESQKISYRRQPHDGIHVGRVDGFVSFYDL